MSAMEGSRYVKIERLEERRPGIFHRALNESIGNVVALQHVDIVRNQGISFEVLREAAALRKVQHPNVVRLLDVYVNDGEENGARSVSLAFELWCTNMQNYLVNNGALKGVSLQRVAYQCVLGIECLHSNGISHNFLKTANVLIDPASHRVAISDLPCVSQHSPSQREAKERDEYWPFRGQPLELAFGASKPCRFSGDIWALGCLVGEMAMARSLFPFTAHEFERWLEIFQILGTPSEATWPGVSRLPHFSKNFPKWRGSGLEATLRKHGCCDMQANGLNFLELTLRYDPTTRPSAENLRCHPFFYDIKNQAEVLEVVDRCTLQGGPPSLAGASAQFAQHGFPDSLAKVFHQNLKDCLDAEITETNTRALDLTRCARADLHRNGVNVRRLQCLHNLSEKYKPTVNSVQATRWCKSSFRESCLEWCIQAYQIMEYPDDIIFETVLTLDRCAQYEESQDIAQSVESQKILLAVVLIALKLTYTPASLSPDGTMDFNTQVTHLSRGKVDFQDVIKKEMKLVSHLHGVIGVPTLWDIFAALGEVFEKDGTCDTFANFLLQLSLGDVQLLYGHSHTVLATAVWLTSMYAVRPSRPLEAAMPLLREALTCFADLPSLYKDLYACCHELLGTYSRLCLPFTGTYPTILRRSFATLFPQEPLPLLAPNWPWLRSFLDKAFSATTAFVSSRAGNVNWLADEEKRKVMEQYYKRHPAVARFETLSEKAPSAANARATKEGQIAATQSGQIAATQSGAPNATASSSSQGELETSAKAEAEAGPTGDQQKRREHCKEFSAGTQRRLSRVMQEYYKGHPNVARFDVPSPELTQSELETIAQAEADVAADEVKRTVMEEYYKGHPNVSRFATAKIPKGALETIANFQTSLLTLEQAVQASGG